MGSRPPGTFWVLEDTSSYHERGLERAKRKEVAAPISMRLYRVTKRVPDLVAETNYSPGGEGRGRAFKGAMGLELLRRAKVRRGIVVAGSRFLQGATFLTGLADLKL